MAGKCYRIGVLSNDPSYGSAVCNAALKFVETHPPLASTRVDPFDEHQSPIGNGHLSACEPVPQKRRRIARRVYVHSAIV